ncbi:MAG TPA: DNA-directed RNA polymerase subunit beta', partial [Candidatus Limnocylindrales bacterium]|nr:DNA-directed RNA polymerase subunit beta' [Candidatus Limnocylindrales bacterium]
LPSRIGQLLDMSLRELEKILYFEEYVVIDPGKVPTLKQKDLQPVDRVRKLQEEHGADSFKVGMGAEAIRELLRGMDLDSLARELRSQMGTETSAQKRKKIVKRLKVMEAFLKSGNQPEWMILEVLPVIPPELRPLVPLDGGRFATSDLNDLYRRVINRNNRLKRLIELRAPEIIIRNEKRMLQEAVDALFDNGRRGRVITGPNNRPLKSLSDTLKGKQGRFRQNLLGKRVDYSGRSVIVVGPYLKLHQCGLPKKMAVELFKPFILRKLEERGLASSIKAAKKFVEKERPEVWDILEEVIKEHPILLNRAPTLHRLGIQAFEPILVEGKAIEIHPLVCTAFNADFDGDQMAVHVPLSMEAQMEAQVLMLSSNNILSPSNGAPVAIPSQDMVFGIYYLTKERPGAKGEGRLFADSEEVRSAYDAENVDLQARIRLRFKGNIIETTVGRTLLNDVVPEPLRFTREFTNKELKKREIAALISDCYNRLGNEVTVAFLDELKDIGFRYATLSGLSIGISDMLAPSSKGRLIENARRQVAEVEQQYQDGVITNGERYNKVVDIWAHVTEQIADDLFKEMEERAEQGEFNPIYMMADSGARGSKQQIRQLAGMRGLMAKPSGEVIETPITSNFREGLTVLEYFTSTHGARKGLADTALKTADSGYLTRRLVDVSQDVIVSEYDCNTVKNIVAQPLFEGGEMIQSLGERVLGRVAAEDVRDPLTGEIIVQSNTPVNEELAKKIEDSGLERVRIRSALTCETRRGICVMCYGRNLGTGHLAELGEAVGIIAAQSIGEPGTQLTMRTFHIGGTASGVAAASAHYAKFDGILKYHSVRWVVNREGDIVVLNRNGEIAVVDERGRERQRERVVLGAKIKVKEDTRVRTNAKLAEWDNSSTPILTEVAGTAVLRDIVDGVTIREIIDETTGL